MKKLFIWTAVVLGVLAITFVAVAGYFYLRLVHFGDYPSGGALSVLQSQYDVVFYDIHLTVDPESRTIEGYTLVRFRALSDALTEIELDLLDHLEVASVTDEQNRSRAFKRDGHKLFVQMPPIKNNSIDGLKIYYHGKPLKAFYPPWKGGFNWSKDIADNHWIGLSCQGEGAKVWIPCKDHPSDEPDSAGINITVPEGLYCASNGVLDSIVKKPNGLATYHWMTRYPINNYCLNISIGKFDVLTRHYVTFAGDTMPVIYYVLPQHRDKADSLIDMAVDMLTVYRKYFGEYPFVKEKFGLADNDYLGMEHQTLNAYGNDYDFEEILGHRFDGLMLHEMGHEWWGNKVTAKDWSDFWIHEGFCTYGESLYHLEKSGENGYHEYMRRIKNRIINKQPIISGANVTTTDAYHPDIYSKGAYLLHSMRFILGDSVFFHFIKSFATDSEFTYKNLVSTEQFIRQINHLAKNDLRPFISMFLTTNELPEIIIERVNQNNYHVTLSNCDYNLPLEIKTDKGTQRYILSKKILILPSLVTPVIDEKNWFLKKVIFIDNMIPV